MGFCLGTANIIPGVSGGTFLLVFGIYERVFLILNRVNRANIQKFVQLGFKLVTHPSKEMFKEIQIFLSVNDFIFLIKLILGAVAAIVALSSLMKYLIVHQFSATYSLFFGLIMVSIIIPVKNLKQKRLSLLLFVLAGAAMTIYVTVAVNPYTKAKMKSDMLEKQYTAQIGNNTMDKSAEKTGSFFHFSGTYSPVDCLWAVAGGCVSVAAMVLPGVSGSLVLILMGQYFEVVSAISALKTLNLDAMVFLGCFMIGIVFGGLSFSRMVNWVLQRYHDPTMAFLTGLMAGSLYALWPFKKSIIMAQQYYKYDGGIGIAENVRVYTNINILPQGGIQLAIAAIALVIGCIVMSFFIRHESEK